MASIYEQAAGKLKTGDDVAARALLQSRAELGEVLKKTLQLRADAESVREGRLRQLGGPDALASLPAAAAKLDPFASDLAALRSAADAKRLRLKSEVAELYASAEAAVQAGDEAAARKLLASWKDAKSKLDGKA